MMDDRYSGRALGKYYFYRNGDRVRFSWDVQHPDTGEDLPLSGWEMPLSTAQEMAANLLLITYPTRWQALRAVWEALNGR